MPTQDEHAEAIRLRMPPCDVWDNVTAKALFRAMAGSDARMDDAIERHVLDYMPDTMGQTGQYIPDWARVLGLPKSFESAEWNAADSEGKAAIIRAALRKRRDPSVSNLQALADEILGAGNSTLTDREHPAFLCGLSGAGSHVGQEWVSVWTLRYMVNVLGVDPDDFSSWTSATHVANTSRSPITELVTADEVTGSVVSGLNEISHALTGVEDDDPLRLSVWFKSGNNAIKDFQIALTDKAGATQTAPLVNAKPFHRWQKQVLLVSAGAGGGTPVMRLRWDGGPMVFSFAVAGVRDLAFEARMQSSAPAHTTGEFMARDEDLA